ncbi:MAG: alkaline phosphatase, partial [Lachnospiraceae bacterium]|nr:alkaline phosphatase [Lachnospiraceae bacterium]
YTGVANESEMNQASQKSYTEASENLKVWGAFNAGEHHMVYDIGLGDSYENIIGKGVPTLAEMTDASIKMLSQDKDGFFLMVEGSKIDYGNHHRMMTESAGDWIAFDEAFKIALDFAKKDGHTAIAVLPDHNTGLNSTPNDSNMKAVVKLVQEGKSTKDRSDLLDFSAYKGSSDSEHTGMDVGMWLYLPDGAKRMDGISATGLSKSERGKYVVDNSDITPYLASLVNSNKTMSDVTNELYVDVTSYGSCSNGQFTFDKTKKKGSVTINTDIAKIDGVTVDLEGKVCIQINNSVYAPKALLEMLQDGEVVIKKDFEGEGTIDNPYLIQDENDLMTFTSKMASGEKYSNVYFNQTEDIDMSKKAGYAGIGSNGEFAGVYNGQGHTINLKISSSETNGIAVFPYITGTIKNLGTTGSIQNSATDSGCAGIARSIRQGGKIYNCWSTVDLTSKKDVGGISWTVKEKGYMSGCYYKGKISTKNNYGVAHTADTAIVSSNYYILESGSTAIASKNVGGESATELKAATLNSYKEDVKKKVGLYSTDEICNYVDVQGEDFAFEGSVAKLSKLYFT